MLIALNTLTKQQSEPTECTAEAINQHLYFAETHPNVVGRYKESYMVLNAHSDASYLSEPKARIRVGGVFFVSSISEDHSK